MQRLTFNEDGYSITREPILYELRQRIRDVRPGPDGLIYVLTDQNAQRAAHRARRRALTSAALPRIGSLGREQPGKIDGDVGQRSETHDAEMLDGRLRFVAAVRRRGVAVYRAVL